jgi:hypothetical protein
MKIVESLNRQSIFHTPIKRINKLRTQRARLLAWLGAGRNEELQPMNPSQIKQNAC